MLASRAHLAQSSRKCAHPKEGNHIFDFRNLRVFLGPLGHDAWNIRQPNASLDLSPASICIGFAHTELYISPYEAIVERRQERVAQELASGRFIGPEDNPAHPGQKRVIVRLRDYPHVVPLVVDEQGDWFLKTIIPSRKARKEGKI